MPSALMEPRNWQNARVKWQNLMPELTVSDFSASLEFCTELLGFTILFSRYDGHDFAYLELEEVQLMLSAYHEDGWHTGPLDKAYGRGISFEIALAAIDPLLARFERARVTLFREPRETWYRTGEVYSGQREFLGQDPDGYLLCFCQSQGERHSL